MEIKQFWQQMRGWERLVMLDQLLSRDFFSTLEVPAKGEDIAARHGLCAAKLAPVLTDLVRNGLLEEDGTAYTLSEFSRRHLVASSPESLVGYVRWKAHDLRQWQTNAWDVLRGEKRSVYDLTGSYSNGRPGLAVRCVDAALGAACRAFGAGYVPRAVRSGRVDVQGIIEGCSRVYPAAEIIEHHAAHIASGPVHDMGCGTGEYSYRLLAARPDLHAILSDINANPAYALRNDRARTAKDIADRARIVHLDFLREPLPRADAVMVNNVFMDHADDAVRGLLGKIAASGAHRIVAHEFMDEPDAISSGYGVLAIMETHGRLRSRQWWADQLAAQGYRAKFEKTSYGSYCIAAKK